MNLKQGFAKTWFWIASVLLSSCGPAQILGPQVVPTPTLPPARVWQTFIIEVPAGAHWFDTGLEIEKGQYVAILATDNLKTWGRRKKSDSGSAGPATFFCDHSRCHLPPAYYGQLIGRFASGTPFRIYTDFDFTAPVDGTLFLSFNTWSIEDNFGEFAVTVMVK
jgi:hypothetical protein